MTAVAAERETVVNLTGDCTQPHCLDFAWKLHRQLTDGYTRRCSIMPMPTSVDAYLAEHRTMRKRAARAERLGYVFAKIDRQLFTDDVFAINTSTGERQGRPMSPGYLEQPKFSKNPLVCLHHHVWTYGVLRHGHLVAYLWLYRSGELAMVSSILGHADHLADDVMYLLVSGVIADQIQYGGTLFYNLHSSGTDGLRYFKERIGLRAGDVRWEL